MAMKPRTTVILIVVGVLLLSVLGFTYMGCSCKRMSWENFEDVKETKKEGDSDFKKAGDLSAKEKELFENLKENKLSDEEINKLVKAKVLTEDLVEKFLEKLQTDEVREGFASPGPKNACARQ